MIIIVCSEIINISSMLHHCLFNEQACFFDDNIIEWSTIPMCSRLGRGTFGRVEFMSDSVYDIPEPTGNDRNSKNVLPVVQGVVSGRSL